MDDPVTHAATSEIAAMVGGALAEAIKTGTDPADVARAVVDAVQADTFYVVTHPDQTIPMVRQRMDDIIEGRVPGPSASPG